MLSVLRRKLAMGVRVRDFCRIHPADDPTFRSTLEELEQRLARADALAAQQRDGAVDRATATLRRRELRRLIQSQLLPQLARAGARLAKERPDLAGAFRLTRSNSAYKTFQTDAQAILGRAVAIKDQLVAQGMPAAMFDALTRTVAEFDEMTSKAHEAKNRHIGATADLVSVTDQIMELVRLLGGFNEFRFDNDPELKAAWESASDIVGPFRSSAGEPGPADGETPPGRGLAPAA